MKENLRFVYNYYVFPQKNTFVILLFYYPSYLLDLVPWVTSLIWSIINQNEKQQYIAHILAIFIDDARDLEEFLKIWKSVVTKISSV